MWLEIGLLHIFKEGKCLWYIQAGSQRHSRYKVISNGGFYRVDIIISFKMMPLKCKIITNV